VNIDERSLRIDREIALAKRRKRAVKQLKKPKVDDRDWSTTDAMRHRLPGSFESGKRR
jgi:hypothetical protein